MDFSQRSFSGENRFGYSVAPRKSVCLSAEVTEKSGGDDLAKLNVSTEQLNSFNFSLQNYKLHLKAVGY